MTIAVPTFVNRRRLSGRGVRALGSLRHLSLFLIALVLVSVFGTYYVLTQGESPVGPPERTVKTLTIVNLVLLATLLFIVTRRLFSLWSALKQGAAGSRLQTRIIIVFGLVTILPAMLISAFSAFFFTYNIKTWFDDRVSIALEESVTVAEAYLEEHKEVLRADALAMASDIKRELDEAILNPAFFTNMVNGQAALRGLTDAIVFEGDHPIAHSRLSFSAFFTDISEQVMQQARRGEIVIQEQDDKITAFVMIDEPNMFLLISRLIDGKVLAHMEQTQGAVSSYQNLKADIGHLQLRFSVIFIVVTLVLLLSVVWYGIVFAGRLLAPLSQLVRATERVRAGDYSPLPEFSGSEENEIGILIRRFNRMTEQLQTQRQELTQANRLLDERRRFTEAVLESASAGVLAVDADWHIVLYNRSAAQLLGFGEKGEVRGEHMATVIPEIGHMLKEAEDAPDTLHQSDLTLLRDGKALTLHARISSEMLDQQVEGYVITFDDISALVSAQRSAAWSDVARRIAHEIKNPLTPIQLSTERLKKKYLPEGEEDRATFQRYLDTISRHTRDIGTMVEEFVSFARMPQPKFREENIASLIRKSVFSAQTAHPEVRFDFAGDDETIQILCDERQVSQILTNVLKNAAESIERREGDALPQGEIRLRGAAEGGRYRLAIEDNGVGFPPDNIEKMLEPYVTTRAKGTGLGLAIVRKIMEEHGGGITLANRENGPGARVDLVFPLG